ncbi:hypothetical protein MLD38_029904 [Melastoma candidum]|uniref:Uncharacterized protein n=1 Tax=Melastoma candidum TaxID=119954 RepID=A0ACB9MK46_9MYRT|nr:hypothetical protein MLD38_029904 [Melastoma candidum]
MAADSPTPTTLILLLPPPSPPPSLDPSPIQYILALLALVSIPILIYLFLFAIRRPSLPTTIGPPLSSPSSSASSAIIQIKSSFTAAGGGKTVSDDTKCYEVETNGEDVDEHACVVCLSGFDGREATKQLSICKHAFHASCIEAWLDSNGNTCPICRASISHRKKVNKERHLGPSEMV